MSRKVDILYNDFQESRSQELQNNIEYQKATKACLENMRNLRETIPAENKQLLNKYDDSLVELHGIALKEYYNQGFKDGNGIRD